MRFLLLSDTHGKLGIINELAAGVHANAVIHAGDFGFYDDESYERLSERELRLQIVHSDLIETVEGQADRTATRIFVSHVSPGKEPFVELVAARTRADVTVSGHMGAPTCMVWNPFAVSSVEEAASRLQDGLEKVRVACLGGTETEAKWAEEAFAFIGRIPEETVHIGRRTSVPRWYREMTHINLPDGHVGYAILDVEAKSTAIQSALSAAKHEGNRWHHH